MAGIGFVLERILEQRGFRGIIAVSITGALVVAGPWLITTIALTLLNIIHKDSSGAFFAFIVYSYAATLVLTGGYHYAFTRKIADLLYLKDYRSIKAKLGPARVVSFLIGLAVGTVLARTGSLGWSAALATAVVSLSWIEMLSLSLLRRFALILTAYVSGAVVLVTGVSLVGEYASTETVIAIFALSQAVIVVILAAATTAFLARESRDSAGEDVPAGTVHAPLKEMWFVGTALYLIMWVDKFAFWVFFGTPTVIGLPLFNLYDQATFIAQLSVIPAMIHFTVRGETSILRSVKDVARTLKSKTFADVQKSKYQLIALHRQRIQEQVLLQIVTIVIAGMIIPDIVPLFRNPESHRVFIQTLLAAQAYLLLYTETVNLLYLANYKAVISVLVVSLAAAALGALATVLVAPPITAGISLTAASIIGAIYGEYLLIDTANELERLFLTASIR